MKDVVLVSFPSVTLPCIQTRPDLDNKFELTRMHPIVTAAVVAFIFVAISIRASQGCSYKPCDLGYIKSEVSGTCIKWSNDIKSWQEARDECKKDKGDLIKVLDGKTNHFLSEFAGYGFNYYWIGLNDIKEEGKFRWLDGDDEVGATFWSFGSSHHRNKDERDCVAMIVSFYGSCKPWYIFKCSLNQPYICEKTPDQKRNPSTPHPLINFHRDRYDKKMCCLISECYEPVIPVVSQCTPTFRSVRFAPAHQCSRRLPLCFSFDAQTPAPSRRPRVMRFCSKSWLNHNPARRIRARSMTWEESDFFERGSAKVEEGTRRKGMAVKCSWSGTQERLLVCIAAAISKLGEHPWADRSSFSSETWVWKIAGQDDASLSLCKWNQGLGT
ncbi:hypothetical protein RRG08_049141 [Elysia crispata]|uniref:C-type lectin domain-containing protein n=1 Tax=Elysia crispata TaxID=231223 RepID=A0AAE0YKV1_9GAST|nr:hypothetical protein RRG08_049141 [Elysia crispata]